MRRAEVPGQSGDRLQHWNVAPARKKLAAIETGTEPLEERVCLLGRPLGEAEAGRADRFYRLDG